MFEEFHVNAGAILIPTGEYNSMDGTGTAYAELPVVYFSRDKSHFVFLPASCRLRSTKFPR